MGSGCTKEGSWDANWTRVTVHEEAVCGTATRGLEDRLRTEGVLMGGVDERFERFGPC